MTTQLEEALAMDGPLHPDLVKWWQERLPTLRDLDELFDSPLHPLQRRRELEKMLHLVADSLIHRPGLTVMEIGADKGGSAWAWLHELNPARMIVCEIRGTPYWQLFQMRFRRQKFCWLPASSYAPSTVEQVQRWLGDRPIDVLFLDGDKSFFDRDFDCYLPVLATDAVVFFHDVQDTAPREAYERVLTRGYRHLEIVDTSEVAELGQPVTAYEHWLKHWNGASCGVGVVFLGG